MIILQSSSFHCDRTSLLSPAISSQSNYSGADLKYAGISRRSEKKKTLSPFVPRSIVAGRLESNATPINPQTKVDYDCFTPLFIEPAMIASPLDQHTKYIGWIWISNVSSYCAHQSLDRSIFFLIFPTPSSTVIRCSRVYHSYTPSPKNFASPYDFENIVRLCAQAIVSF